ncbi:MAG: hypothetical protein V3G42_12720 [Oscillospiraceae bacterium]
MMMGIFKLNLDYQEILRLDSMLNIAKIPHIRHRMFDGWKIAYIADGKVISDVVEHMYSYGHERDLIELMDFSFLTGKEEDKDEVIGYLSAYEIFKVWNNDYRKRKQILL